MAAPLCALLAALQLKNKYGDCFIRGNNGEQELYELAMLKLSMQCRCKACCVLYTELLGCVCWAGAAWRMFVGQCRMACSIKSKPCVFSHLSSAASLPHMPACSAVHQHRAELSLQLDCS